MDYREPLPPYRFLADAFFRLHRRRQFGEHGFQPLSYQEMADFCERVLKLPKSLHSLYYRAIEATDNAVLYDQYKRSQKAHEEEKQKREKKSGHKVRTPRSKG